MLLAGFALSWLGVSSLFLSEAVATSPVDSPVGASEFQAMLGRGAPAERIETLSSILRAVSIPSPSGAVPTDLPLFALLRSTGTASAPRFEATDIELDVVTVNFTRLKVEHANVILEPAADGLSCRFQATGVPFGVQTRLAIDGTVTWATGPLGGDRLQITYRLDDAPVDVLRGLFPERIDASYQGSLNVHGKAEGVIGEESTEDAPATPLLGELEASLNWSVLGRTAPLSVSLSYSLDDHMVRIRSGRYAWEGMELQLKGWFDPWQQGKFNLRGGFANVDTHKVAVEWDVPAPWRPTAVLSGEIKFEGTPGKGLMRYQANAAEVKVPGLGGYAIRLVDPKFQGSLAAINAEISVSTQVTSLEIGKFVFPSFPLGLQYWRDRLTVSTSNTSLWGGNQDGTFLYQPSKHPAWSQSGRVVGAVAKDLAVGLAPELGLDVEGAGAVTYSFGQDGARKELFTIHASVVLGRLGNIDLFPSVITQMEKAEPKLAAAKASAFVPAPRGNGKGTRLDKFFFEIARDPANPSGVLLGGLYLLADDFRFDADGSYESGGTLKLEGTVVLPALVADKFVAAVPAMAKLRNGAGNIVVPVVVTGTTAVPVVDLAPGYAQLLAAAGRGEEVTPPPIREIRHVGDDNLATIPADPKSLDGL